MVKPKSAMDKTPMRGVFVIAFREHWSDEHTGSTGVERFRSSASGNYPEFVDAPGLRARTRLVPGDQPAHLWIPDPRGTNHR